jgi:hypothetical protein
MEELVVVACVRCWGRIACVRWWGKKISLAFFLFGETMLKVEWSRLIGPDHCAGLRTGVWTDALGWTFSPEHMIKLRSRRIAPKLKSCRTVQSFVSKVHIRKLSIGIQSTKIFFNFFFCISKGASMF